MERSIKKGIKWQIIAALILCAVFLLTSFALFATDRALADPTEVVEQTLTVSDSIVHRGAEFDVDISIAHNETGMHAMRLFVTYDRTVMTLVGYEAKDPEGGSWKGSFKAANTDQTGGYSTYGSELKPFVLLWENTKKMYGEGTIVTLTFASKADAYVDPVTKNAEYAITVTVDEPNTIMTEGKTCAPAVSGGTVDMRYGVYRVTLLDASVDTLNPYHSLDWNVPVSIQDVLDEMGGALPEKPQDERYTYEFQSWREVESSDDGNHITYMPTYRAIPRPYELTFRQGIKKEGWSAVDYGDNDADLYAEISTYLGGTYAYHDATETIAYGTIVVFDDYKPSVDYDRHPDYTFRGWYTDAACTQAVTFATMPPENKTLYGYYAYTADPDDVTTTKLAMASEIVDGYVIATLSVTENFGFNALRFALDYDTDKLDFVGFLYESGTPLYDELAPTFPAINALLAAGGDVTNEWQSVEAGYTIAGKHFLFENARGNAYSSAAVTETGKLISFKFAAKDGAAGEAAVGITIGAKDLTRYIGDGSTWYANAVMTSDAVTILRVTKPAPMAATHHYVYNGEFQTFRFDDGTEDGCEAADTDYYTVTNASRKNKGLYDGENAVKVTLKDLPKTVVTWGDGSDDVLSFSFEIEKLKIAIPAEDQTPFVYNYNPQTYTVATSGYYGVTGTSRMNAGSQEVTITLVDTANTCWEDDSIDPIVYTFTIAKKSVTPPTQTTESYVYNDGAEIQYLFATSGSAAEYDVAHDTHTKAGAYVSHVAEDPMEAVKVTLKDAANTEWDIEGTAEQKAAALYFDFTIAKKAIAKPVAASVTYTYNGEAQTFLFIANEQTYPAATTTYYTVANQTHTGAGAYVSHVASDPMEAVKVALKDAANTEWDIEGTAEEKVAALYFDFTIAKKAIAKPVAASVTYTYNGEAQTFLFTANEQTYPAATTATYTVENETRTNAGAYVSHVADDPMEAVKVALKDTANTEWDIEGTAEEKVAAQYFDFTIAKKAIAKPVAASVTYTYTGEAQTFLFTANETTYPAATTATYTVANETRTNAGAYVSHVAEDPMEAVKVALKDAANTEWDIEGTAEQKVAPQYFDFTIAKQQLIPLDLGDDLVYTGSVVKPTIELAEASPYEVYENNGGTSVGTYPVVFVIKAANVGNYEWKDPDDGHADRTTVNFRIVKELNNYWTVTPYVFNKEYDGEPISVTPAQALHSAEGEPVVTFYSGATKLDGAPSDAGTYTVNFKVDGTDDYNGLSATRDFTISPKTVTKPTATTKTYVYNGEAQTYEFANPGDTEQYFVMIGEELTTTMTAAGSKLVEVYLKNPGNYVWKDGTISKLEIGNFVIQKKKVLPPTTTTKTYVYTGASQTYEFAGAGDALRYTVVGTDDPLDEDEDVRTRTRAGSQSFVTRLNDTANTEWDIEGTAAEKIADIEFVFTIAKKPVTKPTATTKTYVYSGEAQTYEFANPGDTEQYDVKIGGVSATTMTAAGTKAVTVSLKDPDNYVWAGGDSGVLEIGDFVIRKKKVLPPTTTAKTYVYTGASQTYEFASAGDALRYTVVGTDDPLDEDEDVRTRTRAGSQSFVARLNDTANTEWDIEGTAAEKLADIEFVFTINPKPLTIPTQTTKTYVYSGEAQTYEFANAGDTEQYRVWIGEQETAAKTDVGSYTVRVSLRDTDNYVWADGSTMDKNYSFAIRYASLTATTGGEDPIVVTISAAGGLAPDSVFSVEKATPDVAAILAFIAASEKVGLDDLTADQAAALVENKCLFASLKLTLSSADATNYYVEIALPGERSGIAAIRIREEAVEVFNVSTEEKLRFFADALGTIHILADHAYDREVALPAYLVSAATCEAAAVYYKSCSCGEHGDETFVYGDPLGHDYDFSDIEWRWGADHLTATAHIVCARDDTHVLDLPATVRIVGRVAPKADESGYVEYVASVEYGDETYSSDPYRELLPATGHVYSDPPSWLWKEGAETYVVKATFVCECGESEITLDAIVTSEVGEQKIRYTAQVAYEGVIYRDEREIDRPVAIFLHNDGTAEEDSVLMLPGAEVVFYDLPARAGFTFVGWRTEGGTLIEKGQSGEYPVYRIGYERKTTFTAEWRAHADVNVSVRDTSDAPIAGAVVKLYESEVLLRSVDTDANGSASFEAVPYGNYKLVVEYPYFEDAMITRSDGLDVDQAVITVSLVLPRSNFNTVVEGDGSAEGLEDVITDEEKNAITDGTTGGTINEIVITQKRVQNVTDEVKQEITDTLHRDDPTTRSTFVDYYDVTIVKTTTARNASGVQYVREEYIKEAERFQTNIFPLTAEMRAELVRVNGSSNNIFVYKRHTYDTGVVMIAALPKVSEQEGRTADFECFFIKVVSGVEYIAIRQKEYSVLAFGASPDPILLANEITSLALDDIVFGDALGDPTCTARYGAANVLYTYSTELGGTYVADKPTAAGTYYLKAFIPATNVYGAAEKVISFHVARKTIARPAPDTARYEYDGTEKVYGIAPTADYTITGARQTNAGTYVVTVALADPANTVWDSGLDAPLTFDFVIAKKKLADVGGITFEDKTFWFTGRYRSISISGDLPEGITVDYVGNHQFDLGKYEVKAVFHSTDPNYDVSEPMIAYMTIRLNWIPIVILIVIVFTLFVVAIVIVEKLLKRLKNGPKPPKDGKNNGDSAKEGGNND